MYPLIELTAVRLDPNGAESADMLSLEQIDQALSQSRRIVLEGPAGRGKTTTLIQLAHPEGDARAVVAAVARELADSGQIEPVGALQEHYAALDVRARLLGLRDDDRDDPAWAEPLRMIAETFAEQTGGGGTEAFVVAGAIQHGLPIDYAARLRAVQSQADPRPKRRTKLEAEAALAASGIVVE